MFSVSLEVQKALPPDSDDDDDDDENDVENFTWSRCRAHHSYSGNKHENEWFCVQCFKAKMSREIRQPH